MFEEGLLDADHLFHHLPVAVIVARNRTIVKCNARALDMFRATREQLSGESFAVLYPERKDFENAARHFGPLLSKHADFHDDRLMRRLDGTHFWVTVRGHGFNEHNPYELAAWVFTDVDEHEQHIRAQKVSLTAREREVAALLVDGLTSKEAAKRLGISPRTVDIHRCSLLKKYAVKSTGDLIKRIVG
ncbi:LuxR C-terminal-related transcriptional regulator [Pseudomonas sp. LFM046]|uniref:LuxR C-terminal-related transcriptional regulator n=1 Tax=Pseudomonas sp. LFM046 TaxID=1608357 RepID=UPI000695B7BE|nr:LuxR C-terminal-related transcriptional regulator [Pseudomonas sp. LFM046]